MTRSRTFRYAVDGVLYSLPADPAKCTECDGAGFHYAHCPHFEQHDDDSTNPERTRTMKTEPKKMTAKEFQARPGAMTRARMRELAREVFYRGLAKAQHEVEGEIEIDDDAQVNCVDPKRGAYVQAWVWVDAPGGGR